ncbi:MAG: hypothetical protein GC154_05695 [bacterium]|nr:hypothetical protein [bacterium]
MYQPIGRAHSAHRRNRRFSMRDGLSAAFASLIVFCLTPAVHAQTYVDLSGLFDTDTVLEAGGAGLTAPLDDTDGFLDATTLPAGYTDGQTFNVAGGGSFQFAPFMSASLDAVRVDGQTIDVADGQYGSVDLALMAAPGSYTFPFGDIEFVYSDGSTKERFGPIPSWMASATAYDNTYFTYSDDSSVDTIAEFDTLTPDEDLYRLQDRGTNSNGSGRFIDGTGFQLYVFDIPQDLQNAKLGITVGNNFLISVATEYHDPEASISDGYTVIANSQEIYGVDHHSLGNLKLYEYDLTPFIQAGTGELYLLISDASPNDGWGPDVRHVAIYNGEVQQFNETLAVKSSVNGTLYAEFQTDGNDTEAQYLYDNRASGPSNRGHRFADGNGSLVYHFDLPDDVTDAKLTVDMANNFIVGLSGPLPSTRLINMIPNGTTELDYLYENNDTSQSGTHRFADGTRSMTYRFDLPNDLTQAFARIDVANQFIIEIAGADENFTIEKDWVGETGEETRDASNRDFYPFDLSPYLAGNAENVVYIRFSDGQPADGWGPDLYGIEIVDSLDGGDPEYTTVLNSMDMFGVDVHNEANKDYYTIDLAPVLTTDNPGKNVFVRFTDASTNDGWGPGIFWMAVYSGDLTLQTGQKVFAEMKTTSGEPQGFGAGPDSFRYELDSSKTLTQIKLPAHSDVETDSVYLLGATLNPGGTRVADWSLF